MHFWSPYLGLVWLHFLSSNPNLTLARVDGIDRLNPLPAKLLWIFLFTFKYEEIIEDKIPKETKFRFGYVPQITDIDRNFPALVKDVVEMGRYAKAGIVKSLTNEDKQKALDALKLVDRKISEQ